nr:hypothetical protein [Tanacetum cinerariifolium]
MEVVGVGNIVTNSRVTPSWKEIVSLTVLGKLRQHQHRHHQQKLKLHMYLNLFHTQSLKQRLSQLGKKVEAIPKSAWTEKDQIANFLKEVNEELRKVRWWEIVRRRPTAATKDHMISSYDVLIYPVKPRT